MESKKRISTRDGEITCRMAQPQDAELLRLLRLEALLDTPEAFGADYQTSAERSVEWWIENLQTGLENQEQAIWIAETARDLVGMAGLYRSSNLKSFHNAMLWGVYVKPAWRGLHLIDPLIEGCLDWGREHGVEIARLSVVTTNVGAIRAYLRCGFTVYGVEPRVIRWEGRDYDELLMVRVL